MTSTVVVDGVIVTFGDTDGDLTKQQQGGDQDLTFATGADVYVGDANAIGDHATGGDDTLRGVTVFGDAFALDGHGAGGNDMVRIGAGESNALGYGDAEVLAGQAQGGNDTLGADVSQRTTAALYGDASEMSGHAVGGDDLLTGTDIAGAFTESGDALTLSDHARGGADTIATSAAVFGYGEMYGDGQTLTDQAQGGNDSLSAPITGLYGPPVSIAMYGDGKTLDGHAVGGNDTFSGTSELPSDYSVNPVRLLMYGDGESLGGHSQGGDDVLIGGRQVDLMWGDAATVAASATTGADRFEFSPLNGHDEIMDYQPGKDVIALTGFGIASFQDLTSHFQTTADGVLISFDADDDILVHGVTASQLAAGDFVLS